MSAKVDMTGKTFGRWTVVSYTGDRKWRCICDCGLEKDVDGASLRAGRSVGCISCHTSSGPAQQNRNYRRNRPVIYQGRTVLVCDLAIEVGLPQDILKNRIFRYGWDIERAANTPVQPRGGRR